MFDLYQRFDDEEGGWDEQSAGEYCDQLFDAFAKSPEGVAYAEKNGRLGWALSFLDMGFDYVGNSPPEMSLRDVNEILFELFPRKVSVEADEAAEIIGEIRAFWTFLGREYQLPSAVQFVNELDGKAEMALYEELSNPDNFGMAKSMVMAGKAAGFDMTTQAGAEQFMAAYNAMILANQGTGRPSPSPATGNHSLRSALPKPKGVSIVLSRDERKAREKLRQKKLGRSKRR